MPLSEGRVRPGVIWLLAAAASAIVLVVSTFLPWVANDLTGRTRVTGWGNPSCLANLDRGSCSLPSTGAGPSALLFLAGLVILAAVALGLAASNAAEARAGRRWLVIGALTAAVLMLLRVVEVVVLVSGIDGSRASSGFILAVLATLVLLVCASRVTADDREERHQERPRRKTL